MVLNYGNIHLTSSPEESESESVNEEEEEEVKSNENREDLERGKVADQELIFFADDFQICH